MRSFTGQTVFDVNAVDQLERQVSGTLAAAITRPPDRMTPFRAEARRLAACHSEFWFCSYGTAISLRFPESDYVRVQIRHQGSAATRIGHNQTPVTANQACISSAAALFEFADDYQQIVWRIPSRTVAGKLAAMTGDPVTRPLGFSPALDVDTPQGRAFLGILDCMLTLADAGPGGAVLAELEQALIVALLTAGSHSEHYRFEPSAPHVAPYQVRRAESYIEAHWNEPIRIEDLAAVAETSSRSLFRTFKEHRGYSPMEFARQLRLRHARRMLQEAATTVTDTAYACGFGDLSQFSRDYARAFGEPPSMTLRSGQRAA